MSKILEAIDEMSEEVKGKKISTDISAGLQTTIKDAIRKLENISLQTGPDCLLLKWGTWKSWNTTNPEIKTLLREYGELGETLGGMSQKNTPRQKEILCEIIDLIDGVIQNDWDGNYYTKEQAKKYIMKYDE